MLSVKTSPYEEVLEKEGSVPIHYKNIHLQLKRLR